MPNSTQGSLDPDERLPNPYSIDGPRPFARPKGKPSATDTAASGIPVPASIIPRQTNWNSSNDTARSRTSLDASSLSGIPVPTSSLPRPVGRTSLSNDGALSRTSLDASAAAVASTTSLPSRNSTSLDLPNPFDKENRRGPSSDYQRGVSRIQASQRSAIPVPALPSPKAVSRSQPYGEFGQAPPHPAISINASLPLPPPAMIPVAPKPTAAMIHARNYSLPLAHPRNRAEQDAFDAHAPTAPLPAHIRGHSVPLVHANAEQGKVATLAPRTAPSSARKPPPGQSGIPRPSTDERIHPSMDVSSMDHSTEGRPWPRPPVEGRPRPSMEGQSRLPVAKARLAPQANDAQFPRPMHQAPIGSVQIVSQPKGKQGMTLQGPPGASLRAPAGADRKGGPHKHGEASTMSDSSSEKKEGLHEKDDYTYLDNKPLRMGFCWCCYYRC